MAGPAREITFLYRNWRGEVAMRRVVPFSISFGTTDWHPEPQWLLTAEDIDKDGAIRDFALRDCIFATDLAEARTRAAVREALEEAHSDVLDYGESARMHAPLPGGNALTDSYVAGKDKAAADIAEAIRAQIARLDAAPSAQPEGGSDADR